MFVRVCLIVLCFFRWRAGLVGEWPELQVQIAAVQGAAQLDRAMPAFARFHQARQVVRAALHGAEEAAEPDPDDRGGIRRGGGVRAHGERLQPPVVLVRVLRARGEHGVRERGRQAAPAGAQADSRAHTSGAGDKRHKR